MEGVLRCVCVYVCFGKFVVVYFGVGYGLTVTRFVLINICTVLMTGPSYIPGEVITSFWLTVIK